jgi:hypothetical protein
MRSYVLATFMLAATLMTGCTATVTGDAYPPDAYPPDMAYVSPGVQVIADYNEPIFFTDGFYWRFYGGTWYRSNYYTGGWVYARPPAAVLRIDRPYAYVHYRPVGYVARRPASNPSAWRGSPAPRGGGWQGAPATPPPRGGGWRGGPQPAPAVGRAPVAGGWRGGAAPGPQARPAPPPQSHPSPGPARPARGGGGWRH